MSQQTEPTIAPPHPAPSTPRFLPPANACDSHCHVFGPERRFPYSPTRTFTPHDVPEPALRRLHQHLSIDRAVIVQSACHGYDHAALIDALRSGRGRYRGVALLGPSATRDEVNQLHDEGVRGVRLQFMPHLGTAPSDAEVRTIADLVVPFGWHVAVHVAGHGLIDRFSTLSSIRAPLVIDHVARIDLDDQSTGETIDTLKRLLDSGNAWVKLSAADRVSRTGHPYEDAVELAVTLAAYAPERVVWGTDFPHPNVRSAPPDDGLLLDLVPEIVPNDERRHKLLVSNPASLFDFPDSR